MWFYFDRIFVLGQIQDQQLSGVPRGNLSDLYPRWLGARELILHGRNPYADDITRECELGYYGRVLDPSRPSDPDDRQAFAYPLYVVFLLAPFVWLPFDVVHSVFNWILLALTVLSVPLWLRALRWRLPWPEMLSCASLLIGSVPGLQAFKLQQLTLAVAFLLAGAAALVVEGRLTLAGILLALSTIKPQLAWPLVLWLTLWTVSDWRSRRSLAVSFAVTLTVLLTGSAMLLPAWPRMFILALRQYHQYTHNSSVPEVVAGFWPGRLIAAAALLASAWFLWRWRTEAAGHRHFALALALVMALTVLIVPMIGPYNQVLLFPSVIYLARAGPRAQPQFLRFPYLAWVFALAAPWLLSLSLTAVSLAGSPSVAMAGRKFPFLSVLTLPLLTFALVIAQSRPNLAEQAAAL